jgi:hypothetical protein
MNKDKNKWKVIFNNKKVVDSFKFKKDAVEELNNRLNLLQHLFKEPTTNTYSIRKIK